MDKNTSEFYLKDPDGKFHIASGMDDIIELDYKNQEMRQAMIDAMKFWVRKPILTVSDAILLHGLK
jgi:glycosidase